MNEAQSTMQKSQIESNPTDLKNLQSEIFEMIKLSNAQGSAGNKNNV